MAYTIGCFDGTKLVNFLRRAKKKNISIRAHVTIPGIVVLRAVVDKPTWTHGIYIEHEVSAISWPAFMCPFDADAQKKINSLSKRAADLMNQVKHIAQQQIDKVILNLDHRFPCYDKKVGNHR